MIDDVQAALVFGRLSEDIIRAGKSAFDGNAAMVAKFNKDLILRARRAGKNESDDAPPAAPQNP